MLKSMSLLFKKVIYRFSTLFVSILSLLTLTIMMTTFRKMQELANIGASLLQIGLFLLLQIPNLLPILIPIALFFTTLFWLHEWNQKKRLHAMLTLGLPFRSIISPILFFCSLMSCFYLFLLNDLTSHALHRSSDLVHAIVKKRPHQFLVYALGNDPNKTVYSSNNTLYVQSAHSWLTCSNVHIANGYLKAKNLHSIQNLKDASHVESVKEMKIPITFLFKKLHQTFAFVTKKSFTNTQLIKTIKLPSSYQELAKRATVALLCILLPLLALAGTSSKFRNSLIKIIIFFTTYALFLSASKTPYPLVIYTALPIFLIVITRLRWRCV